MLSRSTTKVKIKTTNLANKTGYTSNISIPYDGQKNHDLESFLDPSPLTRSLIFGKNTAICRSCVQVQSHELRMSLHFPKNCMTKLCRRESKDTLRQKHALALCTKRKQSFSDHDDHKIQRWFLFFLFLRAKLIRKERDQQYLASLWIPPGFTNKNCIHQQSDESI